jgi:hypothetical protein
MLFCHLLPCLQNHLMCDQVLPTFKLYSMTSYVSGLSFLLLHIHITFAFLGRIRNPVVNDPTLDTSGDLE